VIGLLILGPLYTLAQVGMILNALPKIGDESVRAALQFDALLASLLTLFSMYAGLMLARRSPRAVATAKSFLISMLGYSLLMPPISLLLFPLPSEFINELIAESIKQGIGAAMSFAVWYTYLVRSKRVKATYST
jgi:hypothetical protein